MGSYQHYYSIIALKITQSLQVAAGNSLRAVAYESVARSADSY